MFFEKHFEQSLEGEGTLRIDSRFRDSMFVFPIFVQASQLFKAALKHGLYLGRSGFTKVAGEGFILLWWRNKVLH